MGNTTITDKAIEKITRLCIDILREYETHGDTITHRMLAAKCDGMITIFTLYEGVSEDVIRLTLAGAVVEYLLKKNQETAE